MNDKRLPTLRSRDELVFDPAVPDPLIQRGLARFEQSVAGLRRTAGPRVDLRCAESLSATLHRWPADISAPYWLLADFDFLTADEGLYWFKAAASVLQGSTTRVVDGPLNQFIEATYAITVRDGFAGPVVASGTVGGLLHPNSKNNLMFGLKEQGRSGVAGICWFQATDDEQTFVSVYLLPLPERQERPGEAATDAVLNGRLSAAIWKGRCQQIKNESAIAVLADVGFREDASYAHRRDGAATVVGPSSVIPVLTSTTRVDKRTGALLISGALLRSEALSIYVYVGDSRTGLVACGEVGDCGIGTSPVDNSLFIQLVEQN